jgi:hypothetical protein
MQTVRTACKAADIRIFFRTNPSHCSTVICSVFLILAESSNACPVSRLKTFVSVIHRKDLKDYLVFVKLRTHFHCIGCVVSNGRML